MSDNPGSERVTNRDSYSHPSANLHTEIDHCTISHEWEPVEVETLHSAATLVGAALYSHQTNQKNLAIQQQIIEAQRDMLHELSTPLIPLNEQVVIMPLIGTIDSKRSQQIMETLLEGVAQQQAELVIVDITGVEAVDTQVAQALVGAAQAVKLLGARVMLTGIQPRIAQMLVSLGVDLSTIETRASLQKGIAEAVGR
jgi:anti-anti-sigma factor